MLILCSNNIKNCIWIILILQILATEYLSGFCKWYRFVYKVYLHFILTIFHPFVISLESTIEWNEMNIFSLFLCHFLIVLSSVSNKNIKHKVQHKKFPLYLHECHYYGFYNCKFNKRIYCGLVSVLGVDFKWMLKLFSMSI